MQKTQADIELQQCLKEKTEQLRQGILHGRPYVWELRLSLDEFNAIKSALNKSISSHDGEHEYLLTEDYAVIVIIYLAEWYKRFYKGVDTVDENKIFALSSKELERLFDLAKIDRNTFVYNASKNPDRTNFRWLESLQILGGLAIQAELRRDENDPLLTQLCKIFHGEEIGLDELKDRNRAVAFQKSIARQHSLYEYLKCILEKDEQGHRNLPFDESDIQNNNTFIPQFIKRIEKADGVAKKNKFDFEWIIYYTASRQQMTRQLKVLLKPEIIGGGRKQYIGYDRLQSPEWGIEHPEDIGRIKFYLRFKNGNHLIQKEDKSEETLFKYDNTGSEETGFLCVNNLNENIYSNVPTTKFDKVEIVIQYNNESKVVQTMEVPEYMQVYATPRTPNRFTTRKISQATTAVVFSSAYHLADDYKELPIAYARFRNGEQNGDDYCWCPINDKVVIVNDENNEILPFFNCNGLFQVITKQYLNTIKYKENIYVVYKYVDADLDDEEMQEDALPVLFGRSGLEVRHYANGQANEPTFIKDYDLYWQEGKDYIDWNQEEPQQGALRLKVIVKDYIFKLQVYYVPFSPSQEGQPPIWRDFENMRICTALKGVKDIKDDFKRSLNEKESDTRLLEIGSEKAKILLDIYRPVLLRELSQKRSGDAETKIVSYHGINDDIRIPLINCEQFSIRDFSEYGVKEYQIKSRSTVYYNFPTFNKPGLSNTNYLLDYSARRLTQDVIPLDYLKIYLTKADDHPTGLYAWNYQDEPRPIDNATEMQESGIVFQSLNDNDSPRHYSCPTIFSNEDEGWDDDGWDDNNEQDEINGLYCFETVAKHKVYFFLFNPLIKVIADRTQIKDILLPLIVKRNYVLTDDDINNLYLFAIQFHFDWMLLPREVWEQQISEFVTDNNVRQQLTDAVINFFLQTPKCTDDRERACLEEFLNVYWTFNTYPRINVIAEKALNLILNKPDALGRIPEMKDFLKIYDECRFKFIEMSKAINND